MPIYVSVFVCYVPQPNIYLFISVQNYAVLIPLTGKLLCAGCYRQHVQECKQAQFLKENNFWSMLLCEIVSFFNQVLVLLATVHIDVYSVDKFKLFVLLEMICSRN